MDGKSGRNGRRYVRRFARTTQPTSGGGEVLMRCTMSWSTLVVTLAAVLAGDPSVAKARIAQASEPPAAAPAPTPAPQDAAPTATQQPPAAPPAAPPPAPAAPARIKFNFKGATFQQVIDFFSRTTGLPVIWKTPAPD